MNMVLFVLSLTGLVPLFRAWWSNRRTSLVQALHWTIAAWLAWTAFAVAGESAAPAEGVGTGRYLALALTGCAGIAVLGARRPYVGAWNFVVLGLLAVLLLPIMEGLVIRRQPPGPLHFLFLAAILAVGILNYLPTRLGPAALFLTAAETGEMLLMIGAESGASRREAIHLIAQLCLILVPWIARASWRRALPARNEFDGLWLRFRNRFGLVWGQRLREQFNRSAENAAWPVYLTWRGLRRSGDAAMPDSTEVMDTLRALLKRFDEV